MKKIETIYRSVYMKKIEKIHRAIYVKKVKNSTDLYTSLYT